ncbi:DUF1828 domain-containing protein [candidate division WOR-3 bacterium]|uniref:DUF1828 domain-containing protein n=1 Tax=candidate division WOR-3 bacterium TaxID=2052148 RepID=A0A9D5K8J5_UNCW3|nr:DUF1828 domain-containing protein [candidate division WOR-3 bacterium]MBD3364292.1 DUF1828 domain-containing protein [candidate division WOR-3 bacterium]
MVIETIEHDFKKKICEQLKLEPEGIDRYRIFTPFMFDDGDHLVIVLKRSDGQWILSDEGHTYMHLTYSIPEKYLQRGGRQGIITNALSMFDVEDRDGELRLGIHEDRYGDALYSFIQALVKISDVSYLSREWVRSTFMDDFRVFIEERIPENRRIFKWHDPERDPEGKYIVDCRVNGLKRPLFIFALQNDSHVRDATISILKFEQWRILSHPIGIFENQIDINRKVLARFSDVCEKQFSSLIANKPRISDYLGREFSET